MVESLSLLNPKDIVCTEAQPCTPLDCFKNERALSLEPASFKNRS